MNEADREVLLRLERASRSKQERFMQQIADRLGRQRVTEKPEHPFKGAPPEWHRYALDQEEQIALFSENWKKAGGHVFRFPHLEAAKQFIAEKAEELRAHAIIRQNQPELNALGLESAMPDVEVVVWQTGQTEDVLRYAAGADIGITMADYGVAYTGSLVCTSSGDQGRSVSLLPAVVMAILPAERMSTRLGEVLAHFDGRPRAEFPAGIHFISGPSRSADIENDLTIGVHGPGVVFALIVG
ncbi:LUD domain-containing protein [Brevibacillus sp. AY1]|uniref:LutC/YkgG family protein n=1 Tax=Brevibacillus sp. AY1 TaxID=2807621 RepID=UPI0024565FCF|nr:LUD domain-containing protein [Brevibacillus sp. AY1]MDH4616196.1 LUD domain-containing protein [Brevibacillus sp. AY1]